MELYKMFTNNASEDHGHKQVSQMEGGSQLWSTSGQSGCTFKTRRSLRLKVPTLGNLHTKISSGYQ